MVLKSKIINILIIAVTTVLLISCKKSKYDVIPDVYVDFIIDLSDPEFFVLNAATNSMIVTSATNNLGYRAAGYGENGIIVHRSAMGDEFYAYDRTCPHDYAVNGLSIKVNVDFLNALCPKCSTNYSLEIGGTPISGPGRYPLKNYKTSFNGQSVHVWNSF
jgi:nitrite reductase/ring-hydroxylating ferredoxin subunit